jgi:predicted dehydrogenase
MSIEIAIVGAGEVVNTLHLPSWKRVRGAKVVAICDINSDAARNMAHRWKIPHYYTQFAELLDREKPLLVDICTPPATHLPLTVQALEAGCNVLLEKPMAMTLEDSEKIIEAYTQRKDKRLKLGVIHNWLFNPPILRMLSKVKKGEIGDIIGIELKAFSTQNDPMLSDPSHWCHSLPAGRFGEGLIHLIYLLCRLLGDLELESLWVTKRGPYPWVAYDELVITFSAGKSFGIIYNSLNSPMANLPVVTIYGTKAHLRFEGYDSTLIARRSPSDSVSMERIPTIKKSIDILGEIYQLSRTLSLDIFNKVIFCQPKTAHEIYFTLFIDSLVNNKELPLAPEEAYRANKIFLQVLSELEKVKPWRPNSR